MIPIVGCVKCGAIGLPPIGHEPCPGQLGAEAEDSKVDRDSREGERIEENGNITEGSNPADADVPLPGGPGSLRD